jgi:hypothetical protein
MGEDNDGLRLGIEDDRRGAMRTRQALALALCAASALALVWLAPSAAAAGGPGVEFLAAVPGSHNYSIEISNKGHKQVVVTVAKREAETTYTVRARVNRNRIEADFGSLGRISVRYTGPKRIRSERPRKGCGPAQSIDLGSLRGAIRFSGEDGYTEVALHRTPALRILTSGRACNQRADRGPAAGNRHRTLTTAIGAVERSGGREVAFVALGLQSTGPSPSDRESEPGLFVIASESERRESVAILRQVLQIAESGVLLSDPGVQPVSASVALPPPFSGSASLSQDPGAAPVWSGDLHVSLPGARGIPLTGPGFEPVFCRAASLDVFDACLRPLEEAESSQLSGSQSQAFLETRLSWLR